MNKAELVGEVAGQVGLTKRVCREAIDAITSTITDSLARGEKKARRGRNPQTGKEIQIPAKDVPKFEPGKNLKEAVA